MEKTTMKQETLSNQTNTKHRCKSAFIRGQQKKIGRFLQPDTLLHSNTAFGMNPYMYVDGNPIMYNDPSGHISFKSMMHMLNQIMLKMNRGVSGGFKWASKGISGGAHWAAKGAKGAYDLIYQQIHNDPVNTIIGANCFIFGNCGTDQTNKCKFLRPEDAAFDANTASSLDYWEIETNVTDLNKKT